MNTSPERDYLVDQEQTNYQCIPVYVQSIHSVYSLSVEIIEIVISEARLIGTGKKFKRMIIQNLNSALEGVFVLIFKLTLLKRLTVYQCVNAVSCHSIKSHQSHNRVLFDDYWA